MIQQNENHQLLSVFQKLMQAKKESFANLQEKKKEFEKIQIKKNVLLDLLSLNSDKDIYSVDNSITHQINQKNIENNVKKTYVQHFISDSFAIYNIGFLPISKENKLITKFYSAKRIFYSVKGNYLTLYTLETDNNYELIIRAEDKIYKGNEGWLEFCSFFSQKFELKSIYDFFGFTDPNVAKKIEEICLLSE